MKKEDHWACKQCLIRACCLKECEKKIAPFEDCLKICERKMQERCSNNRFSVNLEPCFKLELYWKLIAA